MKTQLTSDFNITKQDKQQFRKFADKATFINKVLPLWINNRFSYIIDRFNQELVKMNQIICGDALEKSKKLPNESVNCVMTSPPYWALRDYGDCVESIWDGDKDCKHNWESETKVWHGDRGKGKHKEVFTDLKEQKSQHHFCSKCGAWEGQLGLEPTFDLYIKHLCDVFDEVKRVLRDDGTCWVNIGDTYGGSENSSGHKEDTTNAGKLTQEYGASKGNQKATKGYEKSLVMIPFRFAIEMVNRGWILRNTIIWHKRNCMPSSVKDRFTVDFEYLFFFSKSKKYYFETQYESHLWADKDRRSKFPRNPKKGKILTGQYSISSVKYGEQGRNKRTVWVINPKPFKEAHFAVYPEELCETPIKAGCPVGGIVLDPFFGAGTTGLVALKQNKKFIGIELNKEYIKIAEKRLKPFLEQTKL